MEDSEEEFDEFWEAAQSRPDAEKREMLLAIGNIKRQLGRLAEAFKDRSLSSYRTGEIDKWLNAQPWEALTKNDARKIFITLATGAKRTAPYRRIARHQGVTALITSFRRRR